MSADERVSAAEQGREHRVQPGSGAAGDLEPGTVPRGDRGEPARDTFRRYSQAMLIAQRAQLVQLRDQGLLGESGFIRIQRELDLEPAALLVR